MSYAIGDKVLFVSEVGSSAAEGHIVEAGCHGYVKIIGTDEYFFRGWVNADTHVICKLTTTPKPKKTVTRPRVERGGAHYYRIVDGVIEKRFPDWGTWEPSVWNKKPISEANVPDVEALRAIASLIERPTETVEVDDE